METEPTSKARRLRRLLWLPVTIAVAVLALLASSVGIAGAQDVTDTQPVQQLRLGCQAESHGDQRGILCKWSEARIDTVRGYQLYRSVNGSARELIKSVGPDGRLAHFDTDITAPSTITYGVVALNRAGRVIGVSNPVTVHLGRPNETLRLACSPDNIGGQRGILCRWSQTQRPDARGYLLYRSVGGGERQVIARVGIDGRPAHFDTKVRPGSVHVYYVAVVNAAGEVIGSGGPVRVLWPTDRVTDRPTDRATDRPTDRASDRPSDRVPG